MYTRNVFAVAANLLAFLFASITYAAAPVVTSVAVAQRVGTNLMDVAYSLDDPDSPSVVVTMLVSTNAGASFEIACPSVAGDVGAGVTTGANKQIVWNVGADVSGIATSQMCVRILADDGIALIPAGNFAMGDTFAEGGTDERPVHTNFISAFYIGKYEVTYTQWTNVRTWATSHGYTDLAGGNGKATNHPVQSVSWYNIVKWCNARSEMMGLTPCYYTNAAQTVVYRTGNLNVSNEWVNWTANGYRLPTEAEWEKAARGGAYGMRFPWADANTITNARANYCGNTAYAYDLGPTGYNPLFTPGGVPYTSPVGRFAPNGYGVYDMAGSVFEWCWDRYGSTYYSSSPSSDPRGPGNGTSRVLRGGDWRNDATYARVALRYGTSPDGLDVNVGFRCMRGL